LSVHGAVLLEIGRGLLYWGKSFLHFESRTLHGQVTKPSSLVFPPVLFCQDYQRSSFSFTQDHYGMLRGNANGFVTFVPTVGSREERKPCIQRVRKNGLFRLALCQKTSFTAHLCSPYSFLLNQVVLTFLRFLVMTLSVRDLIIFLARLNLL